MSEIFIIGKWSLILFGKVKDAHEICNTNILQNIVCFFHMNNEQSVVPRYSAELKCMHLNSIVQSQQILRSQKRNKIVNGSQKFAERCFLYSTVTFRECSWFAVDMKTHNGMLLSHSLLFAFYIIMLQGTLRLSVRLHTAKNLYWRKFYHGVFF